MTKKHFGLEVEIIKVTSMSVHVKPIGRWSRQQRSDMWAIDLETFLHSHTPKALFDPNCTAKSFHRFKKGAQC